MKIAIDPGCGGAIAWKHYGESEKAEKMPDTPTDLADLIRSIYAEKKALSDAICMLEKVHSMPKQGVSSTFKFGENFGMIQGVLSTLAIPYVLTTPQAWMKLIPGLPSGLEKGDRKRAIKAFCQRAYPHLKIGLQESDALGMLWVMVEQWQHKIGALEVF